jgi:hypothetical protein
VEDPLKKDHAWNGILKFKNIWEKKKNSCNYTEEYTKIYRTKILHRLRTLKNLARKIFPQWLTT